MPWISAWAGRIGDTSPAVTYVVCANAPEGCAFPRYGFLLGIFRYIFHCRDQESGTPLSCEIAKLLLAPIQDFIDLGFCLG